ncbi:MAG: oligosaccharide flippase family protein [bacterium]
MSKGRTSHSLRRTLASGLSLNLLVNVLLYLGHLIIARRLPRDDYAVFSVVVSFVSLMALFADLGLTLLFVKKFAEAEANARNGQADTRGELLGSMLALRIGMAVLVSVVVVFITPYLGYTIHTRNLMMVMLITLFISSRLLVVRAVGEAFLRGHNKYHIVALFATVDAVVFVGLLYFYSGQILDIDGAIWIYSLCHLPGFLLLGALIYREGKSVNFRLRFRFEVIRNLIVEGFPLILSTAFLTIHSQADTLLLNTLSTPKEVSAYNAGLRILSAILFLPAVFTAVIGPLVTQATVTKKFDQLRHTIHLSLRILLLSALLIAVILTVSSDSVVASLFGSNRYSDVAPLAVMFGWMFIPICFGAFVIDIAIAEGRYWLSSVYTAILMVVSIVADIILIPRYGAFGATISKCLALTIGSSIILLLSERLQVFVRRSILMILLRLVGVTLCSMGIYYSTLSLGLSSLTIFFVVLLTFSLTAIFVMRVVSLHEIRSFVSGLLSKTLEGGHKST